MKQRPLQSDARTRRSSRAVLLKHVLRLSCISLLALGFGVAMAPTAWADCVGYSTEQDRINSARDSADLVAIGTATTIDGKDRPTAGGVPVDVYTFTVEQVFRGSGVGETVRIAAPQDSSISRSFVLGERYFLAPADTSQDRGWAPIDVVAFAAYLDHLCSPTVALVDVGPDFPDAVATAFAGTTPTSEASSSDSAQIPQPTVDEATDQDNSTDWRTPSLVLVVSLALVVGIISVILWTRRKR
ncbi:hypothetical protein ACWGK5_30350 [Rhodococcus qingshengii]